MTNDPTTWFRHAQPFYLYRAFAASGDLLYVGITQQDPPEKRFIQHAKEKYWWRRDVASITLQAMGTTDRSRAESMERDVILAERPRRNITHNGRREYFTRVGHGFTCDACEQPAVMLEYHGAVGPHSAQWYAICFDHLEWLPDESLGQINPTTIGTAEALERAVSHLSPKSWFDFGEFMAFVLRSHDLEAV